MLLYLCKVKKGPAEFENRLFFLPMESGFCTKVEFTTAQMSWFCKVT